LRLLNLLILIPLHYTLGYVAVGYLYHCSVIVEPQIRNSWDIFVKLNTVKNLLTLTDKSLKKFSLTNIIVFSKYEQTLILMAATHSKNLGQRHVYHCVTSPFLLITLFYHLGVGDTNCWSFASFPNLV